MSNEQSASSTIDPAMQLMGLMWMLGAGFIWKSTGELAAGITTGQPPFEQGFGAQFFNYLAAHPDDAAVFNAAMSSMPAYIDSVIRDAS